MIGPTERTALLSINYEVEAETEILNNIDKIFNNNGSYRGAKEWVPSIGKYFSKETKNLSSQERLSQLVTAMQEEANRLGLENAFFKPNGNEQEYYKFAKALDSKIEHCIKRDSETILKVFLSSLNIIPKDSKEEINQLNARWNELIKTAKGKYLIESYRVMDLSNKGLHFLPRKISVFKGLKDLKLNGNRLAFLPSQIQNFEELKTVDLSNNPFLKELPAFTTKHTFKLIVDATIVGKL